MLSDYDKHMSIYYHENETYVTTLAYSLGISP